MFTFVYSVHLVSNIEIKGLTWWLGDKEPACQCRRCGFDPWVGKIPWRRKWQHTQVLLPVKSHGQWNMVAISMGSQRIGHDLVTKQQHRNKSFRIYWAFSLHHDPNCIADC